MSFLGSLPFWLTNYWTENGDPRVADFPLMSTPIPFISILTVYALFVLFLGPQWMANRKPFSLKWLIIPYNLTLSALNAYFFIRMLTHTGFIIPRILNLTFPSDFPPPNAEESSMISLYHLYTLSKIFDLLDTVFFVLRKKSNQVTGLHFYHHFSTPLFGWTYFRLDSLCSLIIPFCFVNSFVHMVMYAYYGLAALGPQMQPYLWWKRYITQLQIFQFVCLILHGIVFMTFRKGYPTVLIFNYQLQTALYLILFTRFYLKSYSKIQKDKSDKKLNGNLKNGTTGKIN